MNKPQNLPLVAIWQLFSAITTFFGILTMLLIALPIIFGFSSYWGTYPGNVPFIGSFPGIITFIGSISLVFMLAFFIISLAAGIGTLQGKSWARSLGFVQAVMSVINVPIGTICGVLIIMYLGKPEVIEYFNRQTPSGNQQPSLTPASSSAH